MGDLEICRLRDQRIIQPDKRFASPVKGLLVGFSSPAHAQFRHDASFNLFGGKAPVGALIVLLERIR